MIVAADVIAIVAFAVAAVIAARDGVDSGALIIGIPPLAVAVIASAALSTASRRHRRWPLVFAIALCAVAMLAAMVSFITPLLAVTAPVCALLITAAAIRLSPANPERSGTAGVLDPSRSG